MKRKTGSSAWQGTGEQILIPTATDGDAYQGVLFFYAVCAFPKNSDTPKRREFARAYDALLNKGPLLGQRDNRYDGTAVRALPLSIRSMENQQILGRVRNGMKRLSDCVGAGAMAAHCRVQALEGNAPHRDTELLTDWVRQRSADTGKQYDKYQKGVIERDAIENARKKVHEFAPVLHLGLILYLCLMGYDADLTVMPYRNRFRDLAEHPKWLTWGLLEAEALRKVMSTNISWFNPDRAVRLLPAEPIWRSLAPIER